MDLKMKILFKKYLKGECITGYSGDNCELSLRLHANQSVGRWNFDYLLLFSLTFVHITIN